MEGINGKMRDIPVELDKREERGGRAGDRAVGGRK